MKICLLGATGTTGGEVLSQALKQGHEVTAIVRTPEKITITDDKLKVVKGDIMDIDSLAESFSGHDAVVSCLGFGGISRMSAVTGYSDSIKSIAGAMKKSSLKRIVLMSSWYSDTTTAHRSGFVANWIIVPILKPVLTNMREMELIIEKEHSDLDYTVVRPPGLGSGPLTGAEVNVAEDFLVETPHAGKRTNRSDVAAFMLRELSENKYLKKMIAITTSPLK